MESKFVGNMMASECLENQTDGQWRRWMSGACSKGVAANSLPLEVQWCERHPDGSYARSDRETPVRDCRRRIGGGSREVQHC